MSRFVDAIIAYRILRKLTTPFEQTDAFKLGIIDKRGRILRKFGELNTDEERDSYTLLDRLVWRVKRIIERVPVENKNLASFAAALALIKESLDKNSEPLPSQFEAKILTLNEDVVQDWAIDIVENFFEGRDADGSRIQRFKHFAEEGVVANSVGAGFTNQANPQGNPNLAGKDMFLSKRINRRKKPNV